MQTQIWTFIFSAIGLLLSLDFVVKTVILKLLEPVFSLRSENSPTVSATSRSCEPSTHPKLLSSRTRSPNTSRYTMWLRALRTLKKSSCKLTFIVTNMSLTGAKSMHKSNKLYRKWSRTIISVLRWQQVSGHDLSQKRRPKIHTTVLKLCIS